MSVFYNVGETVFAISAGDSMPRPWIGYNGFQTTLLAKSIFHLHSSCSAVSATVWKTLGLHMKKSSFGTY